MKSLPELYELEYLFECDAKIIETEIPWYYSGATFSITRENLDIEFYIHPASSSGEVRLYVLKDKILNLSLENIKEVVITKNKDLEGLLVTFDDENYVEPLEIQTKPIIKVRWGTSIELHR
ncbi:hypothetical protein [Paenibacillus barengoltzii]|uniref:Uncharacterized protein n=1 Tax=Paenibacillus barengoltzii J12 TaxID=935846 RepID=A0ABY1M3K1_9BACL|nr:hypothetical protein [Paenibacillus barengoltzii]MEC2343739.1 hypothetical protein [Paenibacillus barengoltzii]SMF69336.1 hypothetical protein SAMN02744124_04391 [Paenibacillus barengoltzii J12]